MIFVLWNFLQHVSLLRAHECDKLHCLDFLLSFLSFFLSYFLSFFLSFFLHVLTERDFST